MCRNRFVLSHCTESLGGERTRARHVALGTFVSAPAYLGTADMEEETMDGLIYLIGLIVIIMAILSFFGLR